MNNVKILPFQVRRFMGRADEDIVLLTNRNGEPFFYPNVFATSNYRNTGKSPNTIARMLRAIGMAITWAKITDRDFDHELVEGNFISVFDADDLASFLGHVAVEQLALFEAKQSPDHKQRAGVVRLEAYRPIARSLAASSSNMVPAEDVAARIRWVAKYAEWHLERRLHLMQMSGQQTVDFMTNAQNALQRLRSLAPSISSFINDDKALEAPDPEVVERIERILQPRSLENPFKSEFIQRRNYLAWRLLLDTGGRRHEIHAAKSDDVKSTTGRFDIMTSKTIARTVGIRSTTAEAFDNYVLNHWTKLPRSSEAMKTGYLFCDEKGKRVSLRAINRIFEVVRSSLEGQSQKITPHTMRRFWNYLFSQQIDQAPAGRRLTQEAEIAVRMRIMGWSSDAQAQRYNRRHNLEAGDKVTQAMMDRLDEMNEPQIIGSE